MYDELVKRLREFASIPEHCENVASCDKCSKERICLSFTNKRIIEVATQAADAIEELVATVGTAYNELANNEANKPRWIPVTERLPEISTWVLTYRPTLEAIWPAFLTSAGDWIDEDGIPPEITHWMPLPEPPKEE